MTWNNGNDIVLIIVQQVNFWNKKYFEGEPNLVVNIVHLP